jgi:hypothetical protein
MYPPVPSELPVGLGPDIHINEMPFDTGALWIEDLRSTNAIVAKGREQRNYMFLVITSGHEFGRMF